MSIIEFSGVDKFFGDFQIPDNTDFSVDDRHIAGAGAPEHFFQNPENGCTKRLLDQIPH